MKNEPVMTLVVGLVAAGCALLVAFGVPLTPEQVGAISAFAVAALGLGAYVRSRVAPLAKAPANPRGIASERGQAELGLLVQVLVVVILVVLVVWLVHELL